jgi:hypothetical protein
MSQVRVTPEIQQIIIEKYPSSNSRELAKELGVSYHTVMKWAQKLNLHKNNGYRPPGKISIEEERLLRELYPSEPMSVICKHLNKKPGAVKELARKYNIKREICEQRKGTLEPLFNKTIESYYWLGFIAADGYISKTGHLLISQSDKDKENMDKMAIFLKTNIYSFMRDSGYVKECLTHRINISDRVLGLKINEMFGVTGKKTYTTIKLDFIETEDQAIAFLCGIIDGDGSKQGSAYGIQCDNSWCETFINLSKLLPNNIELGVISRYRKDRDKFFCHVYIKKAPAILLRDFCAKHEIGSTRKFSQ